jgi:hypothetical protein
MGLCNACYQRIRSWSLRSVRDQLRRLDRLHVWETTMQMGLGNVRKLRRKTG